MARAWEGPISFHYAPDKDGQPDPGEIVWTWVPYEEDPRQGKDRPVVVMGVAAQGLLGVVPLSSKGHDGDRSGSRSAPDRGTREGRPSWVRLDFVLAVPPGAVRREGSVLDRARFDDVAEALRTLHGW